MHLTLGRFMPGFVVFDVSVKNTGTARLLEMAGVARLLMDGPRRTVHRLARFY